MQEQLLSKKKRLGIMKSREKFIRNVSKRRQQIAGGKTERSSPEPHFKVESVLIILS